MILTGPTDLNYDPGTRSFYASSGASVLEERDGEYVFLGSIDASGRSFTLTTGVVRVVPYFTPTNFSTNAGEPVGGGNSSTCLLNDITVTALERLGDSVNFNAEVTGAKHGNTFSSSLGCGSHAALSIGKLTDQYDQKVTVRLMT